jgi:cytochrome b
MTGRITRWLWLAFAAIAIGLPFLPLARPNGAPPPDLGPPWAPNVTAWGIGLALVLVAAAAAGRLAKGLPARRIGTGLRLSSPLFLSLLAVGLAAWSVYTMRSVFASNPVLIDEMAQLFHAHVFASGRLAAPPPEPAAAFLIQHTWITDAGWVSLYPPGHPLALAIGMVLGAEWLVDPMLGGVCVFLVYLVAKGLYGPKTARIAAFLWAISAWVMFMSASYMNHVTATTLALGCWAFVWAPRPLPRPWHVVAAGFCLAAVAATRPLDAVAAGLPVLVWIVARRRWAVVPWMALGMLPVFVAFGYFNWRLFGGPLTLGYNALYGSELNLGFGIDPWGRAFTPLVALANLAVAMRRLHLFLYEWPIPALLPLGLWAIAGRQRRLADAIVVVGLLAVPALYFFYWHSGYYPGPRFYYAAAPFLVIGTARAWRWGWGLARRSFRPWWRGDVALVSAAVIVLIWGWAGVLPARFAAFRTGLATLKLHPERDLAARSMGQALVIVPERWGSRLVVSLWELGIRPGLAERAFNWLDACDLQRFVDAARATHLSAEEATRRVEAAMRASPVQVPRSPGSPDETLHLRTDRPLDPACQREVQRDQAGFTLFGYLAWRNAIGVRSGLVFARDLYDRNAELFARYPGWAVWRYAPPASDPTALPVLTQVVRDAP